MKVLEEGFGFRGTRVRQPILELKVNIGLLEDFPLLHEIVAHEFRQVTAQGLLDRQPVRPE